MVYYSYNYNYNKHTIITINTPIRPTTITTIKTIIIAINNPTIDLIKINGNENKVSNWMKYEMIMTKD